MSDLAFFDPEEPPTTPHRAPSGRPIKAVVIRALEAQAQAEARCSRALDSLYKKIKLAVADGSIPPPSEGENACR